MELKDLLDEAVRKTGTVTALAAALQLTPQQITNARAHRAGIPIASCYLLAALIEHDLHEVIAASELVTEKKPERRAVLLPFVRHAAGIIFVVGVALIATSNPENAAASMLWIGSVVSNTNYGVFLAVLVCLLFMQSRYSRARLEAGEQSSLRRS